MYCTTDIRVIYSRRMRLAGHVTPGGKEKKY